MFEGSLFDTILLCSIKDEASIMCNNQKCHVICLDVFREKTQCYSIKSLIEVWKWFIEDKYIWKRYEHASKCHSLSFTTWESTHWGIHKMLYFKGFATLREDIRKILILSKEWWKHDIFSCSAWFEEYRISKKYSYMFSIERIKLCITYRGTIIEYISTMWLIDTCEYSQKCRFSWARRSPKDRYISLVDIQRYMREYILLIIHLRYILNVYEWFYRFVVHATGGVVVFSLFFLL